MPVGNLLKFLKKKSQDSPTFIYCKEACTALQQQQQQQIIITIIIIIIIIIITITIIIINKYTLLSIFNIFILYIHIYFL